MERIGKEFGTDGGAAARRAAAERALGFVESGMVLGLGSGRTALAFVDRLADALACGALRDIVGVPTSERTARRARVRGIPLTTLAADLRIDLTVDGADEVDPALDLIKGAGGSLLREKLVAEASRRVVIVAEVSKRVARLGTRAPLPVEVVRFGAEAHLPFLRSLGCAPQPRRGAGGAWARTDEGHAIIDCRFDGIAEPEALHRRLKLRTGVVETGLFLGLADAAVLAGPNRVEVVERAGPRPAHEP